MKYYVFYLETQSAKQYRCGSDTFLLFDCCNDIWQSRNENHRRVCIFNMDVFSKVWWIGEYCNYFAMRLHISVAYTMRAMLWTFFIKTFYRWYGAGYTKGGYGLFSSFLGCRWQFRLFFSFHFTMFIFSSHLPLFLVWWFITITSKQWNSEWMRMERMMTCEANVGL